MTCCETASDEDLEHSPEMFTDEACESCELRAWRDLLSDEDHRALQLHTLLASRVVHDLHLTELVFDYAALELTQEDALALIERLSVIHEHRCPVRGSDGEKDD